MNLVTVVDTMEIDSRYPANNIIAPMRSGAPPFQTEYPSASSSKAPNSMAIVTAGRPAGVKADRQYVDQLFETA
ncbi:hypothetical protein A8B75_14370 [Sphingomonadales bacterium EhC05]|jgi:hypothetical protein|nr:hypothetical protein A8B75_14370 [Sphingomonadales bacterium EhC05]